MSNPMKDQPVEPVIAQAGPHQEALKGQPQDQAGPQEPVGVMQETNDPEMQRVQKEAQGYQTVLMRLMHDSKTADSTIDMLKAGNGDPLNAIPNAAMALNDSAALMMKQGGQEVSVGAQVLASQYLIDDLIELGKATGEFEVSEDMIPAIYEDTFQMYIERGLKDKTIDPIQLQAEAQKVMTEEQAAAGVAGGGQGFPLQPSQQAMTQQYADNRVHQSEMNTKGKAAEKEAKAKQQALATQAIGGQ